MDKQAESTVFALNDNSVLFAWFSNCTCDSFLMTLLTTVEERKNHRGKVRINKSIGGEGWKYM